MGICIEVEKGWVFAWNWNFRNLWTKNIGCTEEWFLRVWVSKWCLDALLADYATNPPFLLTMDECAMHLSIGKDWKDIQILALTNGCLTLEFHTISILSLYWDLARNCPVSSMSFVQTVSWKYSFQTGRNVWEQGLTFSGAQNTFKQKSCFWPKLFVIRPFRVPSLKSKVQDPEDVISILTSSLEIKILSREPNCIF